MKTCKRKKDFALSITNKEGYEVYNIYWGVIILRAISVEDLKPGMELARTVVNPDMVVILSEGTVLQKAHITRLTFLNIPAVYIKDESDRVMEANTSTGIFSKGNSFVKEYHAVVDAAASIFKDAKAGDIPVEKTETIVKANLYPMSRRSGVIDYLNTLNHMDSGIYNHSLRVSILAGVIAKWLHFDREKTDDVILAGFLHDIGKTKFTDRLLNMNIERLEGKDYTDYIQHTVDGHHMLASLDGISDGVKLAAMQHHERMDGSGFPFGCAGADIHEYARIIAIADLYDNITTERMGYVRRTPFSAIAEITQNMYSSLDPTVCVPVLTHIKDAFLGSRVLLSNGEKGTIAAFPNDFAALPVVSISMDEAIDLNEHPEITITEYNPR